MPGGIPMETASLNAINKNKRKRERKWEREREGAIQATLVIGGEMGEHERELHGWESLKLKTKKKKKQQSAQSSDSDDHKPPPWSPSPAASSPPPPPAHKIPKTLTFNSANLSDSEKKTTTTLHTKSRENTCGTKITIPNNAKNRRIGVENSCSREPATAAANPLALPEQDWIPFCGVDNCWLRTPGMCTGFQSHSSNACPCIP